MEVDYFHHPNRFPKNIEGPFYTTGCLSPATGDKSSPLVWCCDCLWCEAPELEAPDLLAPLKDGNVDSYFIRQPSTQKEVERACMALMVCCVSAFRYGGKNRQIIERLGNNPELSDYVIANGALRLAVNEYSNFLPFAKRMIKRRRKHIKLDGAPSRTITKLKQFWKKIRHFFFGCATETPQRRPRI